MSLVSERQEQVIDGVWPTHLVLLNDGVQHMLAGADSQYGLVMDLPGANNIYQPSNASSLLPECSRITLDLSISLRRSASSTSIWTDDDL